MNPAAPLPRARRVLLALAPDELAEFLPGDLEAEVGRLFEEAHYCDTSRLESGDWPQVLARERPEVLVTCWQTPRLPQVSLPGLRYVCHLGGSTRGLLTRAQLEQGLLATNWGYSVARVVAEGALALMLSALRRMSPFAVRLHVEHGWRRAGDRVESLWGRRIGLHGFGAVARALTRLLEPFGGEISVFAPSLADATAREYRITPAASLEALFAENDVVVELAPLTPVTRGIVTESLLRSLRPGSLFVNVARGPIVDETALLQVAMEGRILIALDVFHEEPLPADSPLRGLPNVTLTPHTAGPTNDRRRDAGAMALRNLRAFQSGTALEAVVTPEIYDQAT